MERQREMWDGLTERPVSARAKAALGKAIRDAREHAGLSQEELGSLIDKDQRFVSRLESGQTSWPDPALFDAIARETGAKPDDLLRAAGYLPSVESAAEEPEIPAPRIFAMANASADDLPPEDREAIQAAVNYAFSVWRRANRRKS